VTATGSRRPPAGVSSSSQKRFKARARARRIDTVVHVLVTLLVVAVVAGFVWLVGWSQVFALDHVSVKGADGDVRADVRAAAQPPLGTPLVRVDTGAIRDRVAAVPTVAEVDVSRSFPRGLVIDVTPRVPLAVIEAGAGWRLVDATGLAYTSVETRPAGLFELDMPASPADRAARAAAVAVVTGLPPDIGGQVVTVSADSVDDVRLTLATGAEVRWGSEERASRKAAVLAVLLRQPGAVYDVSTPDRPTISAG